MNPTHRKYEKFEYPMRIELEYLSTSLPLPPKNEEFQIGGRWVMGYSEIMRLPLHVGNFLQGVPICVI